MNDTLFPKAHKVKITKPYTPSYSTDIRKTFTKERARIDCARDFSVLNVPSGKSKTP